MHNSEDEFWNSSSHSGFSFEDEDECLTASASSDILFKVAPELSSGVPIYALISKTSLDFILNDIVSTYQAAAPTVEDTIRRLTNGQNFDLSAYIRFSDKIKLLEKTLETCDANVIIKVILFLKATLKSNIFYHQLSKLKVAVKHYAHYLLMRSQFDSVADLYMATGNSFNTKHLYYLIGQGVTNKSILSKKLEQFTMEHLQRVHSSDDKLEMHDHINLIKFQIEHNFDAKSVVSQLAVLFKHELTNHKGLEKSLEFKKAFKIDEMAYDWTLLNVLASMTLWMHINDIFLKNNWLNKKRVLKTSISPSVFLLGLSRHNPPKDVLETFLGCISDVEKALEIANKLQCHAFIIQSYVTQRDRLALLTYKEKVPFQSPDYCLIESALQCSTKQWKN
ncbi:spermatogenesis-defective protein 39 homolog [Euwallacea fornicatus]|uniref:spermatogenesis-defective protein 39 homolog n=1 Tax=Euwallacea fornicatus TaxID=995702 RepID=UPI00338F9827